MHGSLCDSAWSHSGDLHFLSYPVPWNDPQAFIHPYIELICWRCLDLCPRAYFDSDGEECCFSRKFLFLYSVPRDPLWHRRVWKEVICGKRGYGPLTREGWVGSSLDFWGSFVFTLWALVSYRGAGPLTRTTTADKLLTHWNPWCSKAMWAQTRTQDLASPEEGIQKGPGNVYNTRSYRWRSQLIY